MAIITITCEHCKNKFEVPYKHRNRKFCSRNCYFESGVAGRKQDNSLREIRTCLNCNNEFSVRKKQENKLCSDTCRKEWLKKNAYDRCSKSYNTSIKKYGTHFLQTDEFKNKRNKTLVEKYGTTNHMEVPEIKEKFLNTINNISDNEWATIAEKRKNTKREVYGNENYNNREKFLKTTYEKYGDFHLRLPEFQEKMKETMITKYGVENALQLPEVHRKAKEAIIEKYGDIYVRSDDYKIKIFEKRLEIIKNKAEGLNLELVQYKDDYCLFRCKKCGHEFTHTQILNGYLIKCRKCEPVTSNNKLNIFLEEILNEYNIIYKKNDRTLIHPYEIDYFIEDHKLCIEINGNYYHSEIGGGKFKDYHLQKTKTVDKTGYKLIHIFEDEILNTPYIVKSRILNLLKKTPQVIYARKCRLEKITSPKDFLNNNHIQGYVPSKHNYGLYYNDELVYVMTFGKKRGISRGKTNTYELLRATSKNFHSVVGGFSKCLKAFLKEFPDAEIETYADSRWSGIKPTETVYSKNGFKYLYQSPPNYWYVKKDIYNDKRYHRFQFRKSSLVEKGYDASKTEWEIMQEIGYDRIWDCGSMKFNLTPTAASS